MKSFTHVKNAHYMCFTAAYTANFLTKNYYKTKIFDFSTTM